MEDLVNANHFWKDKTVLVTGSTGFKGSWMGVMLSELGAKVFGFGRVREFSHDPIGGVGSAGAVFSEELIGELTEESPSLEKLISSIKPDVVFHMAAQPLVRESYLHPLATFDVNVVGTAKILDICRRAHEKISVINVTTDKCYENNELIYPFRETDRLGGKDPYSASKACSELVTSSFLSSYSDNFRGLATARGGNVLGGGDWSPDRLIPDFYRAQIRDEVLQVRFPSAIRPWQHVLDAVAGYIHLAERLYDAPLSYSQAWTFGPEGNGSKSVAEVLDFIVGVHESGAWNSSSPEVAGFSEAQNLRLDTSKTKLKLGFSPKLNFKTTVAMTAEWYSDVLNSRVPPYTATRKQVLGYLNDTF
jgi:CDP-glucose 4,6-dehydratase